MRDRREQIGNSVPSPVVRYYTWASNDKKFRYYGKESGENKHVFPLKVAYLLDRNTIRGWHDATESSIWSNEVQFTTKEPFNVYSSKPDKKGNTLLATGLYQDIKGNLGGGHFEKVIYAYEEGVGVVKINLKGSGLASWSSFNKELKKGDLQNNLLVVTSFENGKKGATKYTTPTFTLGDAIEAGSDFDKQVNVAYDGLMDYIESKNTSKGDDDSEEEQGSGFIDDVEPMKEPVGEDALPF